MKTWLKTGALVAALWLIVAIVIYIAHASQPTAASTTAYAESLNLASLQGDQRAHAIAKMENMVNRLTFDERQQLDHSHVNHEFFDQLTEDERLAYLDATLPTGFQQMMDSFNKMDPIKRKEIVNRALEQMKNHPGNGPGTGPDDKMAQRVVDQGLKSFYKDANADVKLDLAPLVEQIQANMQNR